MNNLSFFQKVKAHAAAKRHLVVVAEKLDAKLFIFRLSIYEGDGFGGHCKCELTTRIQNTFVDLTEMEQYLANLVKTY